MYDYITFERQYGSGGHEIADALAKRLGYRLYDRGVVIETCNRMGLTYDVVSGMDEQNPIKPIFKAPGVEYVSIEDKVYQTETDIILEAAETPGCIFVGRCASEILKDKKVLKVFVTAHKSFRLERARTVEHIDSQEAEDVLHRFDKRREKFFNAHSSGKWGSSDYFDLVLNSGTLGLDACVDLLEAIIK